MRQTDVRQTDVRQTSDVRQHHRLMTPPRGRGHNKLMYSQGSNDRLHGQLNFLKIKIMCIEDRQNMI